MRKYLLFCLAILASSTVFSQDFSNKGKDFWVGYGYHTQMTPANGNSQQMVLYFATDQVTNITITVPGSPYTIQTITTGAAPTVTTSVVVPKGTGGQPDFRLYNEGLYNTGIHITSDKPMVAYAHVYNGSCSGATILFPTNTLGKEYYSVNYKNWSNFDAANCWLYVVAVDTGTTTVEITPTGNTTGGWVAGTTYTVNLTQGQIYNVKGVLTGGGGGNVPYTGVDLTGSKIKSISSGSGGCKRIGVFSGSGRISITCNANSSSSDNYMVQALPKSAWGKKYLTAPAAGNQAFNIYRVCVVDPTTVVKINGVVTALPLQGGFYYEIPITNQPQMIEGDKPIMVAQYFTSQGSCGNGNPGDPEVIYLSAVEQNINTVQWNATPNNAITTHDINVVVPNGGTGLSSFKLDGVTLAGFTVHPQDANYSYIRKNVTVGVHIITSDSGFNAIAYGFGNAESYGYNAGTNIKDLYQQILVQTQYGIETTPSVCTNSPFKFKVSLPYCADSIHWDLSNLPGPPAAPPTQIYTTCTPGPGGPDSTTVINGKTIYWYSLPATYSFSTIGTFPVTITAYNSANPDGCGNAQDIDFNLVVSDPPIADFNWTPGGCVAEPFQFTETTPQLPKPTYHFWWDFGDPASGVANNTSASRNPVHTFSAPGTYNVRFSDITTPGCLSDTIVHQVIVAQLPTATISGTAAACINTGVIPITFTGANGTAPYTFYYHINAGGPLSVNSVGTTAIVNAPTTVAGVFIYTLDSVKNLGSTLCVQNVAGQTATATVNPQPAAAIAGATTVCLNAPPPPVTFTGSGGTAPYTFAYTINGVPQTPVVSNAAGVYVINAPTNVAGPFIYAITSVTDASSTLCNQLYNNLTTTITVKPLPTATLTGATTVCLNSAPGPVITFTGATGTSPYTFSYTVDAGAGPGPVQTISSVFPSSSATLTVPTTTAGTFKYRLIGVQEGSANTCVQNGALDSVIITVNPLPTAAIAGATTVCLNSAPPPPVTFTGSGGTAPYTFDYTINGVPQAQVVSNAAGVYVIGAPTNVAGVFIYKITKVTDATVTLCNSTPNVSTTITVNALPTATISGTTAVCQNAPMPVITFTGSGGTAPYTFGYSINGVPQPSIVSNGLGVATVSVPTTVANTFIYTLTSVQEGSAIACLQSGLSATATVIVNPLPTATISANIAEVCLNSVPLPIITFTGAGGTLPYTFTYTINGGGPLTISTTAFSSSVTLTVSTAVANTFTYALVSVKDGSATLCSQAQVGSAVVKVDALPTPNFNFTTPSCETRTISFTDASVPNVGLLNGWSWDFGDPASGANNLSNQQNPTHIFSTAGTYTVSLTVTTDHGCTIPVPFTRNVTIHYRPLAGFIIPEVCINDIAAVFTDTSKVSPPDGIDPAGYYWNFGDPGSGPLNTATTMNGTHLYTATGVYQVTHVVTSFNGCKDTIVQPITINGANPVSAFIVNNPATLCANDSVAITNQSTVNFGNVTKIEIIWDFVNNPLVVQTDDFPYPGKIYRHLYPNFQAPLTKPFTIRMRAFSGTLCFNDVSHGIVVNAAPKVQFNNMPNTCLLVPPFQITQASEVGGVPGTGVYSGPGVSPTGIFSPQVAGVGTHTIKYTFTSTAAGCVDTLSKTITVLDTAHALFTNILPICENTAASFTDVSTAPGSVTLANTIWDFGDGTPLENHAPGATFTHVFALPGTYLVKMYNVSAVGCNSTVYSKSVTVDANHHITWDAASGNQLQTVCINTAITTIKYNLSGGATNVIVNGLPAGVTYNLAGTVLTISGSPTTTVGSPFIYTIQTTGNTCTVANAGGTITVQPDHTIVLSSPVNSDQQSVCVNSVIDPIVYTLGGGANNATVTGLPPGITYVVAGNILTITGTPNSTVGGPTFNYSILTSGNGCVKATALGKIIVNPYPQPNFTVDKPSYCIPNAVVIFTNTTTISDGSPMTYLWNFGEPASGIANTASTVNSSHWYSGTGPFNVKLTATSTAVLSNGVIGCPHDTTIVINTIHPQPKADFTTDKPSVCQGSPVTFTDNSTSSDGAAINEWHWKMGDGGTPTTRVVNAYIYADSITYNVTLYTVNTFGCNSDTITKPFTVYPYPHVNAGPDRVILEGGSIVLEPIVFANDAQYLWTTVLPTVNGTTYMVDNTVHSPRINKPLTDMTYQLKVTARGGCSLTDLVFVKLLKFPVIPNTITPNGDGIHDTWVIDHLDTYPDCRVQVFTRTGQLIFESRGYTKPWDGTLKGKPLPVDTYYYIIEPGSGRDPITGYVTIIK